MDVKKFVNFDGKIRKTKGTKITNMIIRLTKLIIEVALFITSISIPVIRFILYTLTNSSLIINGISAMIALRAFSLMKYRIIHSS